MSDLISREAAVSICDNAIDLWNGQLGAGALVAVRDAIKALPSAERHGHWIYTPTNPLGYVCSECGKTMCRFNYCPNCGAKMDEVE